MIEKIKDRIKKNLNIIEQKEYVWIANRDVAAVTNEDIKDIAAFSKDSGYRQFRICFHENQSDKTHVMLIVHNLPQSIYWHMQPKKQKVTYICLTGEIKVITKRGDRIALPSGDNHNDFNYCHNSINRFASLKRDIPRAISTVSSQSVFLEICDGPFEDSDTIWVYS